MEKIEFLKSIVESNGMYYAKSFDDTPEIRRMYLELECEEYLYDDGRHHSRPTAKGMKAIKFNSFEEYESSLIVKSVKTDNSININANGTFLKIDANVNSPKSETKKENPFIGFIKWLVGLFVKSKS